MGQGCGLLLAVCLGSQSLRVVYEPLAAATWGALRCSRRLNSQVFVMVLSLYRENYEQKRVWRCNSTRTVYKCAEMCHVDFGSVSRASWDLP